MFTNCFFAAFMLRNDSPTLVIADAAIDLPTNMGWDAFAEIGLTTSSNGFDGPSGSAGYVGTRIVGAYHVGQSGGEYMRVPVNSGDNKGLETGLFIPRCISVDFRMGLVRAEGYCLARVWVKEPQPGPAPIRLKQKTFLATFEDKRRGSLEYHYHHFSVQGRKSIAGDIQERVLARAAAALEVPARRLTIKQQASKIRAAKTKRARSDSKAIVLP